MPNRFFVAAVGLLLVSLGVFGVRRGRVPARVGSVERIGNPVGFWLRVVLFVGLGVLALGYAMRSA